MELLEKFWLNYYESFGKTFFFIFLISSRTWLILSFKNSCPYFENKFYSYAQIQSNTTFSFKTSNTIYVNSASSDLSMNSFNIGSTGNLDISCPSKILSLGNKASTINIEKQIQIWKMLSK